MHFDFQNSMKKSQYKALKWLSSYFMKPILIKILLKGKLISSIINLRKQEKKKVRYANLENGWGDVESTGGVLDDETGGVALVHLDAFIYPGHQLENKSIKK